MYNLCSEYCYIAMNGTIIHTATYNQQYSKCITYALNTVMLHSHAWYYNTYRVGVMMFNAIFNNISVIPLTNYFTYCCIEYTTP